MIIRLKFWVYWLNIPTFLAILVLIGISCQAIAPTPTPVPDPRHPWVTKWLQNPTCQPPCWENITPGVTGMFEAYDLLQTIPGIKVRYPPIGNELDSTKQMQWQLDASSDTGIADSDEIGDKLIYLDLRIGSYQLVTVQEVIDSYGSPAELALGAPCMEHAFEKKCIVFLLYPDRGMALQLFLEDVGHGLDQVEVMPESEVVVISLFPAEGNYYLKRYWPDGKKDEYFFEWEGYKKYP